MDMVAYPTALIRMFEIKKIMIFDIIMNLWILGPITLLKVSKHQLQPHLHRGLGMNMTVLVVTEPLKLL